MKGKFIVIEGADGSGKGTQHKLLKERLEVEGRDVVTVDFPQYETGFFGKLIGRMLMGEFGEMENIHPYMASVIYAADRYEASTQIKPALQEGKIVLGNRFTLSSEAHQACRLPENQRLKFIHHVREMEFGKFGIPEPDFYFFLKVPTEISQELILQKAARKYTGKRKSDLLEQDVAHQMKAHAMYTHLAETNPKITTINCVRDEVLLPPSEIHELVFAEVQHFLDNGHEGRIKGERQL